MGCWFSREWLAAQPIDGSGRWRSCHDALATGDIAALGESCGKAADAETVCLPCGQAANDGKIARSIKCCPREAKVLAAVTVGLLVCPFRALADAFRTIEWYARSVPVADHRTDNYPPQLWPPLHNEVCALNVSQPSIPGTAGMLTSRGCRGHNFRD